MPTAQRSDQSQLTGFLTLVCGLIDSSRAELRANLAGLLTAAAPCCSFDPQQVEAALYAPLPDRLIRMLSRTLVLEMQVADLRGTLIGETPEERFADFIERLATPQVAAEILHEYSVLSDLLVTTLELWVTASTSFVRHFCCDYLDLEAQFGGDDGLGNLIDVVGGVGDLHRGGRTVVVAEFDSGIRLVYKPRSLTADAHVQQLLAWLNEHGSHAPLRTITVLDKTDHGWVEFVEAAPSSTLAEAHLYYQRLGGLLAVAYVINAIDLHFENLVASGAYPVLVDLETLFHPRLVQLDETNAWERALGMLSRSVMASGLLPQRLYGGATDTGMDVSGIGVTGVQHTPFVVPRWTNRGSTEMRMTRVHAEFTVQHNRTEVDGVPTDPLCFSGDLVAGFESIYRLLWAQRDQLLMPDGPIWQFAEDEVRVLLRPTRSYFRLLDESYHPDLLRDVADRDALFDTLSNAVEVAPALARTIDAERQELWRGDIPLFTTTPSTVDLFSSTGTRIAGVLDEPGLAFTRRRLLGLGEADLQQQRWLIQASLSTLASPYRPSGAADRSGRNAAPATPERLVAAASAIADRLIESRIDGDNDVAWLGLSSLGDDGARLEPLGIDLYDGLPGVALFLAHLGAITGRADATRLARKTIASVLRRVAAGETLPFVGAFTGAGGIVYTYAHLGRLWQDTLLIDAAHSIAAGFDDLVADDVAFDVVGGAAGGILGLASLWRIRPHETTRRAAISCGDRLLASSQQQWPGWAWPSPIPGGEPLTGLSHGAAGIASALIELTAMTGEDRFADAAAKAIEYERSLFVPSVGNWADLRFNAAEPAICQTSWCHGAPGIGLARLRSLSNDPPAEILVEINAAVETTLRRGLAENHCLCHGSLGNIELLLQTGSPELDRWSAAVLDDVERNGPRCATKLGIETPGLMTGLAGIGLQLLRLAYPGRVPSVLALDPPLAARNGGVRP